MLPVSPAPSIHLPSNALTISMTSNLFIPDLGHDTAVSVLSMPQCSPLQPPPISSRHSRVHNTIPQSYLPNPTLHKRRHPKRDMHHQHNDRKDATGGRPVKVAHVIPPYEPLDCPPSPNIGVLRSQELKFIDHPVVVVVTPRRRTIRTRGRGHGWLFRRREEREGRPHDGEVDSHS